MLLWGIMQNDNDLNFGEKINGFVQKNRKGILISVSAVFILIAGLIVYLSLQDIFNKKAIGEVEELSRRFDDVRYFIDDENGQSASDIEALLADLDTFAKKNKKGIAASKAWSMIAQIYSGRKDWQQAESAWLNAAKTGDKTYLAPISLFNAAVAAEEQGKLEQAVQLLEQSVAHPFEFPAAPHAQFSIGRLYEQMNNYPAAIEAYRAVLINWQDIPVWQNLARSRIAAIEPLRR